MLKIIPPFRNPKNIYQGTPLPKFKDTVKKIFKYSKMSIPEGKKLQIQRQIFTDSEKIAKRLGTDTIRPKDFVEIFRHSDKQKMLKKYQSDYISGMLKKGGEILTSKTIISPNAQGDNGLQKKTNRSRKFKTSEEIVAFHKSIEARKEMLKPKELRKKGEDGKTKMNRAETETIPENMGQKITSDNKNAGLASGGIKRVGKPGEKTPASNIKVKDFKRGSNLRGMSYGMPYAKPYKEVPLNRGVSDETLPKFIAVNSDNKLNSNLSDNMSETDNLAEGNDWKFAAYQEAAESPKNNFKEEDSNLGGITDKDDSFGESDWENN